MAATAAYLATANDTYSSTPTGTTTGTPADLLRIIVGTAAASSVVTVYNGTSTSGEVKATIDAATINFFDFGEEGIHCPAGLFVKLTAGNAKVTVVSQ